MASIGGFGILNILVAGCLFLGVSAEKFDVTLHYDKINHDNLETLRFDTKTLLDTHTLTLNQRLAKLFGDKDLKIEVYDVIESGVEEGFPAIAIGAHVEIPSVNSRDAFVKVWEDTKHDDLLLFSVQVTANQLPEVDGIHRFHAKYAAKAVGECANNGILLPNATCVCPRYFSGDDCSLQTCLNGGIISTSRHCVCPPGFTGRHCEQLGCTPYYDSEFNFTTKSFVLAVNLKYDTAFLLSSINSGLADALVQNSAQYSNFVLITYVMKSYQLFSQIKVVNNAADFLGNFSSIYPNDGDILQPHITAINAGLTASTHIRPRSDIYTFWISQPSNDTTYNPYDLSKNSGETVLTKTLLNWGHAFYTVTPYSETALSTTAFKRLSYISNGEYINLGTRTSNAGPLLAALIRNNVNAQTLDVYRNFNDTVTLILNKSPTPNIIYTYGEGVTVTFQGSALPANQTYGNFSIYYADSSASDLVAIVNGNSASARLITSSVNTVVIGYTKSSIVDVSSMFPSALVPQTVVSRITDPNANIAVGNIVIYDLYNSLRTNNLSRTVQNQTRDCNFPTVYGTLSDSSSCTAGEAILISITYQTNDGNTVYRAQPSVCFLPKPAAQVTNIVCNGNGYLNPANGTCVCNVNYSGDNCENVLCQNGGYQNHFPGNGRPKCYCPEGYSGDLCSELTCSTPADRPDTSRITLSLVVQSTWSTSPFLTDFKSIASNLVYSLSNADSYVITQFANITTGVQLLSTQVFTDSSAFTSSVSPPATGGGGLVNQTQNVIAALNSALDANVTHPLRQAVYLFVDAGIGESQAEIDALIGKALTLATPINVVLLLPYSGTGDDTVTCLTDTSAYVNLAKTTGGIFLNFCTIGAASGIPRFLDAHAKFLPNWQTISRADAVSCGAAFNVSVEQRDGIDTRPLIVVSSNPNTTFSVQLNGDGVSYPSFAPNGALAGAAVINLVGLDHTGDYVATVTPSNGASTDQCTVILGVQTGQSVLAGFTANPSIDYTSLPPQYGYPSHPALFISTQLQSTPTVQITINDGLSSYTSTASLRNISSCQFDYYFPDVYSCPLAGRALTISANFTTDDGIQFTRLIQSVCQAPPAGTCLNGGYLGTNSSICTCPIGYSGDLCQVRVCLNGGYLKQDQCVCPLGFTGELCQLVQCPAWDFVAAHRPSSFQYESVVFVVELSTRALVTNMGIADQIGAFIDQVHSTKPLQLILVTFTNTVIDRVIVTTDPHKFIAVFQDKLNNIDNYVITDQSLGMDAIHEAAKLVTYQPAIIYAFLSTDSNVPTDYFLSEDSLAKLIDRGNLQINFYLNRPDSALPAATDPHSGNYYYYQLAATASGGRLFLLSSVDAETAMQSLLPLAVFENAIIEDVSFDDCTTPQTLYFPVDNEVVSVSVNVRGKPMNSYNSVLFYDPSGTLVDSQKITYVASTGSAAFGINDVAFNPQHVGFWRVAVQTQIGNCQIQVRAITANTVRFGFSTDQHSDFPSSVLNTDTTGGLNFNHTRYVTAHIDNQLYSMRKTFLEYVKVYSVNVDAGHTSLLASSAFLPRDHNSCAYQYVSPSFNIPSTSYHGLGVLQIVASGQDAHGETFQRITYHTPQVPTCYNGGSVDEFGYCSCTSTYSGDYCDRPVCQNGGTSDFYVCQCADGYYGDFCEKQVVLPTTTTVAPSTTPNNGLTTPSTTSESVSTTSGAVSTVSSATSNTNVPGSTTSATSATVITESTPTSGTGSSTGYQSTVSLGTASTVMAGSSTASVSGSTGSTVSPGTGATSASTASEATLSSGTPGTEGSTVSSSTFSTSSSATSGTEASTISQSTGSSVSVSTFSTALPPTGVTGSSTVSESTVSGATETTGTGSTASSGTTGTAGSTITSSTGSSSTGASTISESTVSYATESTFSTASPPTETTGSSTSSEFTVSVSTGSTSSPGTSGTDASTVSESTVSSVSASTFSTASPPTEGTGSTSSSESTVSGATESTVSVSTGSTSSPGTSGTEASTVSGSTVSSGTEASTISGATESTVSSGTLSTGASTASESTVSVSTGLTSSPGTSGTDASTASESTVSSVSVSTFSTPSPPTEATGSTSSSESTISGATESTQSTVFSTTDESTYSSSEATTASIAPASTTSPITVPSPPPIIDNCPNVITMGVYLTVVVDTTNRITSPMLTLYTGILNEILSSSHLSSTSREITLFTTSGNGTVGFPTAFANASSIIGEIVTEVQYSHASGISEANLNVVLSKYNPTPVDPVTVAPTIVIFTAAKVNDYPAASATIDRIRTANPRSFVISVPLTSLNSDSLASTVYDATFDLTQATSTSAVDTADKILNFICSVTPKNFEDLL